MQRDTRRQRHTRTHVERCMIIVCHTQYKKKYSKKKKHAQTSFMLKLAHTRVKFTHTETHTENL